MGRRPHTRLMLCCRCLEILNNIFNKGPPHFHFALDSANYVAGLMGRRKDLLKIHSQSGGVEPMAPDFQARALAFLRPLIS